jgi:S-adenosylmethionine/arginine decarboxylase-like enzyme
MKNIMHKHILLRGHCDQPPKNNLAISDWLINLVEKINMKIIDGPFVRYIHAPGNRGATAVVMIETSHIAFHVWDEKDPALLQFDLYTCSELNKEIVLKEVNKFFHLKDYEYLVFDRENTFMLIDSSSFIKEQNDLDKANFNKITNYDI